jgi:hypothetical protein
MRRVNCEWGQHWKDASFKHRHQVLALNIGCIIPAKNLHAIAGKLWH